MILTGKVVFYCCYISQDQEMTFDTKPKANNDIETQTNSVVSEVRFYFSLEKFNICMYIMIENQEDSPG